MAPKYTNPQPDKPKWLTADSIEPKDKRWLWYPYIPYGTITALYGRGGIGKSQLTCAIASALSNGQPLPGQEKLSNGNAGPKNVLMLSAEDDYAEVLVPRLIQAGADRARVSVPEKRWVLDGYGMGWLEDAIGHYMASLIIIDPIVYYAGGKMDINRANEVRAMMESLRETVAGTKSAVLIVGHIRKSQEGGDADKMMGSADWINASRSALFATETNDGRYILKHPKSNYGPTGRAIGYSLSDEGFEWGEMYDEGDLPMEKRGKRVSQAIAFLESFLANGPMRAKELEDAAKDCEIAVATLNRAKKGVAESYFSRSEAAWMWKLIDKAQESPAEGSE